jgi:hypothetical protein
MDFATEGLLIGAIVFGLILIAGIYVGRKG